MKNRCLLVAGAAVTAILALSSMTALVSAEDGVTTPTNPGFAPNTGQINRGIAQQLSSQSSDVPNMPTPEEARAALMTPVSKQPSTGDALPTTTGIGAQEKQETTNTGAAGKINEPRPQDQLDLSARQFLRNFPSATISLIASRSWRSRWRSPTNNSNRSMMR